jgi:RNA methyltransferase, TrmH family
LSIAFDATLRAELRELTTWASANAVPCREESEKALGARADSNQHEGVVLNVRARQFLAPKDLAGWLATNPALCVALDRVRNPQNIGAILRSAAFFGAGAVILGAPAPHPGLPPFALRVAEGGAEHLLFSRTTDLADTLGRLKASGVHVVGTDSHSTGDVDTVPVEGSCVLVFGNEREGLSPRIRAQCNSVIGIRGAGTLDSLNVAVAAGVLLSDLWRRRGGGARVAAPPARK